MTLAFPLLMGEALSSYRSPAVGARLRDRSQTKMVHFALQSGGSAAAVAGLVAVWKSHTLKLPEPMANLYSPHSFLGLLVFALLGLQYGLGFWAYLAPKLSLANRQALGPVHAFLGQTTFVLGLATMMVRKQQRQQQGCGCRSPRSHRLAPPAQCLTAAATLAPPSRQVGIQEKATFLQAYAKVGVFTAPFRLAGALQLALALTGMAVLYAFAPSATQRQAAAAAAAQQAVAPSSVQRMDSEGMPLYSRASLSDVS